MRFGSLGLQKFSVRKFIVFGAVFSLLFSVFTINARAATTAVTYSGSITPSTQQRQYGLATGNGIVKATLKSKSANLRLTIKNTVGTTVGIIDSNGNNRSGVSLSFNAAADTYTYTVSTRQTTNKTLNYSLTISYPLADSTKPTAVITSPVAGSTLSGTVNFSASATDDTAVTKVEFYAGTTLIAADTTSPYSTAWNTTTGTDGQVTLSIKSYDAAGNIGNASLSVTVQNQVVTPPPPTPTYFNTLPVGATLPSDAECASRVKPAAETRPVNATYNATKGTAPNSLYPRATGNYIGTTDEIIQWNACKWGLDEDMARAQAAVETYWIQSAAGDYGTDPNSCLPGHTLGSDGRAGQCPESVGLLQVRYPYFQTAFVDNNAIKSTAYNADVAWAYWRECFEGRLTWLNTVDRGSTYVAGDAWRCMGVWFAGRWDTQPARDYITAVQNYYNQKIWTTDSFKNYR